ncbi:hypothetical protein SAMN02982929_07198 [Saccharopolyspora kobensis]|uniref:PD-(D/E)XK nuclease superfamily protein n=1 Tax=Saccharopolyspora kobensis TaxID=146035 RepID=A0A1H6EPU2_9PSEU|nr:hypothetical protein [Saccharopolyspora kobensis]SEG98714.1 hypothetical protein SAMN02982929_07198 [Saccharopolyspora kobensis]SFD23514.1 hypothetical protein SAMN05216506_103170 [Saccharopolyspora kobensis]
MASVKTKKDRQTDSRFYVREDREERVPGVTSVLNMIPKPFLTFWAAKVVAETALECLPEVTGLALKDKQGAIDFLKGAPRRSTSGAADTGTEVHNLFERIARGEQLGRVHPDYRPYVDGIHAFNDKYSPEYLFVEDTVWSDAHGYAGSFDAIVRIDGETVMLDAKTTRSGVHSEVAMQLSAYAYADHIIGQDGEVHDIPQIDAGAVLHLRPEGAKLVPARVDEETFEAFLVCRRMFDVVNTQMGTMVGKPVFDTTLEKSTGSQRRASR